MINKVICAGNLVADPVLKTILDNKKVCNFTIAMNRRFKDKEEVCFIEVSAWGPTAEFVHKFWKKGKSILVEGRLKQESWQGEEGNRSKIVIVAESVEFFGYGDRDNKDGSDAEEPMVTESKRIPAPNPAADDLDLPW